MYVLLVPIVNNVLGSTPKFGILYLHYVLLLVFGIIDLYECNIKSQYLKIDLSLLNPNISGFFVGSEQSF